MCNPLKLICFSLSVISFGTLHAQTWLAQESMPGVGRHHPVTFSLNDKGYSATGSTSSAIATSNFYEYDPIADTWTTLPNFTGPARGYSIGDTWDGKAYMGFGLGNSSNYMNDLWVFDPVTGVWNELTSCPCAVRIHPAFAIENGLLFVGLGNNATSGNLNDWWEYNISTDTWRQLTSLPGPPRHHPFMFTVNGDIYTGLGHGNGPGTNIYTDWYRWDIAAESWTQMADFPAEGRVAGTQLSVGDRGFILSGDGDNHSAMPTGEFWEYDYQSDTWEAFPPHPGVSRWAPGSFAIGNVIYFVAGEVYPGNPNPGYKNDVWSFDLETFVSVTENIYVSNLVLYPNPSSSFIQLKGVEENTEITLFSSAGRLVWKKHYSGNTIDVSPLETGLYFLMIETIDGVQQRIKFTKQ